MGQIALSIPQAGVANATEDPKVASDMTVIQTWANGNIDASNLSAALAQSIAANQAGQVAKGSVSIAASESRANVAYGTLTTPDQVTGIVLPTNGLIAVLYQATWQESVANAARAAIFIGANQLKQVGFSAPAYNTVGQETALNAASANTQVPLASTPAGLVGTGTGASVNYTGDVTTGQIVGPSPGNGTPGPCYIFAAAGTYTISVQFKASSGSVTASNRKLWVQALAFA